MPSQRAYIPFLIAGMLITGCSNSLWSKWQDMQCVEDCDDPNPSNRVLFEQPVWQTLQMFLGEMLCFLPIIFSSLSRKWRNSPPQLPIDDDDASPNADDEEEPAIGSKSGKRYLKLSGWKVLLLWFPAFCDLTGTTLMNVGLLYTPVSIYQMTRGALVLWVGLFSVMFLRRKLWLYQWLSLVTVMIGVSLVGLSGSLVKKVIDENGEVVHVTEEKDAATVFVGVLFVLFAQIFTAIQFVVEEKIMSKYSVAPLLAVGWEGFFGCLSIVIALPVLTKFKDRSSFFDLERGWHQMINTPTVLYTSFAIALSIAMFNGFGLSVTRSVSAAARSTADTCRTLGIWIVSLYLGWEHIDFPFSGLQVLGFALLVYGTFVFNNLVNIPHFIRPTALVTVTRPQAEEEDEETRALLAQRHLDETAVLPADLGTSGYDVVPPPAITPARPSDRVD